LRIKGQQDADGQNLVYALAEMKGAFGLLLKRSRGRKGDGEEGQGVEQQKELDKMAIRGFTERKWKRECMGCPGVRRDN
jgi:hypothetical protein